MNRSAPAWTPFEKLLLESGNYFGVSFILLLSWISTCDGQSSTDEVIAIRKFVGNSPDARRVDSILEIARSGDTAAIQLACEVVRRDVGLEQRKALFTVFLSVAIADGLLRPSEHYVIRFLADLMELSSSEMNACFQELTGRQFPPEPDPSSSKWWQERSRSGRQQQSSGGSSNSWSGGHQAGFERLRALAILGLDEGASISDIRAAFRRLSQVHHPDRYATLGSEAMNAASASFRRIKDAYDYLLRDA